MYVIMLKLYVSIEDLENILLGIGGCGNEMLLMQSHEWVINLSLWVQNSPALLPCIQDWEDIAP